MRKTFNDLDAYVTDKFLSEFLDDTIKFKVSDFIERLLRTNEWDHSIKLQYDVQIFKTNHQSRSYFIHLEPKDLFTKTTFAFLQNQLYTQSSNI